MESGSHLISVNLHGMILPGKREQERHCVGILLVFRIQAVGLLMPQFQALCGIVHNERDQDESREHHDPLFALYGADSGNGYAKPEQYLGEIIRAAHVFVEPRVAEALGVDLFGRRFLVVSRRFPVDGQCHDQQLSGIAVLRIIFIICNIKLF